MNFTVNLHWVTFPIEPAIVLTALSAIKVICQISIAQKKGIPAGINRNSSCIRIVYR
jgi:hypothetical protein